jgi:glycolate oxidase iron-sulfur subunit
MHVRLTETLRGTPDGESAAAILGRCVHCGFCTATCPTYRVLGDELDGPRGRIYLIRGALEGAPAGESTQQHLDRCLTCRACEPACPSGVEYGRLLEVGRRVVDAQVPRSWPQRAIRAVLRSTLTRPMLFAGLVGIGQAFAPVLPRVWRRRLPARRAPMRAWPAARHSRRVLLLAGCVQPGLAPNVAVATARVLDRLGVASVYASDAGCCGALRQHLGDPDGALVDARRNVDAWWPYVESGVDAIVMNASGCGAQVREYAHLLRGEPAYAERAARIVARTCDVAEYVAARLDELPARADGGACSASGPSADAKAPVRRVAFHPPCTLQHAQRVRGAVERVLARLGATVVPFADAQACCGSAGTYSLLQPALARELRDRKLAALAAATPDEILSANVGCIAHLASAAGVPVRHWIEWVDDALSG